MPRRHQIRPKLRVTLRDYLAVRPFKRLTPDSVFGCPPGNGDPVLVIPGILRGDRQTRRFRDCLTMLEYQPVGWELGINWGPTTRLTEALVGRLASLYEKHGKMRIVGFSMGGLFARFLAQARPHMVSQVITVCSPFTDPLNSAWLPLTPALNLWRGADLAALSFMVGRNPPVPGPRSTAGWTGWWPGATAATPARRQAATR